MKKTLIKGACTMKSLYKIKNEIKANIINLYPKSNRYINLGSGHTRYLGWTNLDFSGGQKHIENCYIDINHDLTTLKPLPFKSNSVECVYCSHVFEHLEPNVVLFICNEVYRILKDHGIFRINQVDPNNENKKHIGNKKKYQHNTNLFHMSQWDKKELKKILFDIGFHFVYITEPCKSETKKMRKKHFSKRSCYSYILECDKRSKYKNKQDRK